MYLFLIAFFSLYGAAHLYAFLKARAALGAWSVYLIPFMAGMVFAPLLVHLAERRGLGTLARVLSWIGYAWMGLLFLFVSASAVLDISCALLYLGGLIRGSNPAAFALTPGLSFLAPLLLSILIGVYGYFEARGIRVERVVIRTPKVPAGIDRLRIVQLSDVHIGLIVREGRLRRIIEVVKGSCPDILVSTGDLVDGQINDLEGAAALLAEIRPRYGKFAVTGNHEFYAGLAQALEFTRKAGFTVLRGEALTVEGLINIAGIDDPAGRPYGLSREVSERELLSGLPGERFTLLLKHRPEIDSGGLGLFDLQLSGHTHKGQIFPFCLATYLYYPVHAGTLKLLDESYLYVSRGAGTWGPMIRFLSPPEVTVIELVRPST